MRRIRLLKYETSKSSLGSRFSYAHILTANYHTAYGDFGVARGTALLMPDIYQDREILESRMSDMRQIAYDMVLVALMVFSHLCIALFWPATIVG